MKLKKKIYFFLIKVWIQNLIIWKIIKKKFHAHVFQSLSIIYETFIPIFSYSEPMLSHFVVFNMYFYRKRSPIQEKNIRKIRPTKKKLIIVNVVFFLKLKNVVYRLCIIQSDFWLFNKITFDYFFYCRLFWWKETF